MIKVQATLAYNIYQDNDKGPLANLNIGMNIKKKYLYMMESNMILMSLIMTSRIHM